MAKSPRFALASVPNVVVEVPLVMLLLTSAETASLYLGATSVKATVSVPALRSKPF